MATIKDIAELAQVSPATVSRILNQDETLSVTEATRKKVMNAAHSLNYIKKKNSSLTMTIGIFQWFSLSQESEDPYYQDIRGGIEKYCADHHIEVVRVFHSDSNYMEALRDVQALICIGKFPEEKVRIFESLTKNVIFVDMRTQRINCNTIVLDFRQAVFDALDHLTGLGHTHVGYLGGQEYLEDGSIYFEERKEAFINYCEEHALCYEPYLLEDTFSAESGYRMMTELIRKETLPTAVFAASDPIAIGAMRALNENGYHVPDDVSIIGFDDISSAAFLNPPLTTIHTPARFMGEYAAHYLTLFVKDSSIEMQTPVRLTLPCELTVRSSCAKPRSLT